MRFRVKVLTKFPLPYKLYAIVDFAGSPESLLAFSEADIPLNLPYSRTVGGIRVRAKKPKAPLGDADEKAVSFLAARRLGGRLMLYDYWPSEVNRRNADRLDDVEDIRHKPIRREAISEYGALPENLYAILAERLTPYLYADPAIGYIVYRVSL